MKKLFTLLIIGLVAVSLINQVHATTCAGAATIPGTPTFPYVTTLTCGTTNDITSANSTTCGNGSYKGGYEAVYSWTPAGNYINVSFAYSGQTWTGIFLYQGCPTSGGTCIGNFTSSGSSKTLAYVGTNMTSGTTISLTSGVAYYIVIDTWPTPNSPCPGTLTINGTLNNPCTGTPAPGNTLSSANPVCSGVNFTLSLQNSTPGMGLTYQWQSSPNGSDPWTNISTSPSTYVTSQTTATYYRCQVTCSGNTGTSNPIYVTMNTWFYCYCACASAGSTYEYIGGVVATGGISHTSGNTPYSDFTAYSSSIAQGASMTVSVSQGTTSWYSTDAAYVFIDYNQDGDFSDAGELVGTGTGAVSPYNITFIVPSNATLGTTRMRIKFGDTGFGMTNSPCQTGYSYGETEDYTVIITGISTLTGHVYDFNSNPISGATIENVGGISTTSGSGGDYLLTPLSKGSQQFKCSKTGYNDVVVTINLPEGGTVTHDFILTNPEMAITPPALYEVLLSTGTATDNLYMTNDGNGSLGWLAGISFNTPVSLAPQADYCACASAGSPYEYIGGVVATGGINNSSGNTPYSDFTAYSSSIVMGALMTVSVSQGTTIWYTSDGAYVYIDYNQDGDFSDAGELVGTGTGDVSPYNISFTIPLNASPGSTRMRIKFGDTYYGMTSDPCQTGYSYGETEDYTVNVIDVNWVKLGYYSGTVPPFGGKDTIPVHFNANIAEQGTPGIPGKTYTANIDFGSNPDVGSINIPVTLYVADASLDGPTDLTLLPIADKKFMLKWKFNPARATSYFIVLRNGQLMTTTTNDSYIDVVPGPGHYCYKVARVYGNGAVSAPANIVCVDYPLAPSVPLSNWALLLGGLLIGTYAFFIIRRRMS
jgi:hypothetical protein